MPLNMCIVCVWGKRAPWACHAVFVSSARGDGMPLCLCIVYFVLVFSVDVAHTNLRSLKPQAMLHLKPRSHAGARPLATPSGVFASAVRRIGQPAGSKTIVVQPRSTMTKTIVERHLRCEDECPSKRRKTTESVRDTGSRGMLGSAFQADMSSGGLGGRTAAVAPKGGMCGFRGYGGTDDNTKPGPVDETDAQHAARHRVFHPRCGRCVYDRNRERLERGYGSHVVHQADGDRVRRTPWLAPRPVRLSGAWGVGCLFCASARQHWADKADAARREGRPLPKGSRGPNAADSAWARFEINNAAQIANRGVRQHAETMQHRKAVKLFFCPEVVSVLESSVAASDGKLFRGGVPQPDDWLRAWRACRTPQSFRASEAHATTDTFIRGSRIPGTTAKASASMARVMSLALRARKLVALREAQAVSISLDDRGAFRLVGFKAIMADGEAVTGRLGLLRRGGNFSSKQLSDTDEDYSRDMATSVLRAIERLAACPRTGAVDAELVKDICRKVCAGVSDGAAAAQKALTFMTAFLPHMLWVGRDRAHAARIATSQPLVKEKLFKEWYEDIFDSKTSLVPSIKNSDEWTSKLILCERQVLRSSGVLGGQVTRIMKTVNFAKQRWDSMAAPSLQFCVMLVPIAMLLAHAASDRRADKSVRDRARHRLLQMPDQVPVVGTAASFAGEAMRFVRLFDVADHDPALTYRESRSFVDRAKRLFIGGRIWDADAENTPLGIAMKAAREAQPLYYDDDGKMLRLFRKLTGDAARELADGIAAVTESMSERVLVEFSTLDLGVLFTSFDLQRWYTASQDRQRQAEPSGLLLLRRHAGEMFRAWHLNASSGVPELETLAFKLVEQEKHHLESGKPRSNRAVWAQVLKPGFLDENDLCRELKPMLHKYLVTMDSTCGIERDLGALTQVLQEHKGPIDDDGLAIGHCLEVMLDGPATEQEFATHADSSRHDSALVPSDLMRECAALWVDLHGRRFKIYKAGRRPGPKRHPEGTMRAVGRVVKKTMDELATRSSGVQEDTVLGIKRSAFQRAVQEANPARQAKDLHKFDALTKKKSAKSIVLACTRRRGGNPYKAREINPDNKLRTGTALHGIRLPGSAEKIPGGGSVLDATSQGVTPQPGYSVLRAETSAAPLLRQVQRAALVVMDSTCLLDRIVKMGDRALTVEFLVVALGKWLLDARAFSRCRPGHAPTVGVVHYRAIAHVAPKCKLRVTDALRQESPVLYDIIHQVTRLPTSVWVLQAGAGLVDATLASRTDVRQFLLTRRRAQHSGSGLLGGACFSSRPS